MLYHLKETLLKIRKNREQAIIQAKAKAEKLPDPKKIRIEPISLIPLDLPFKTDPISIFEARGAAYKIKDARRNEKLGKTIYQVIQEWQSTGSQDNQEKKIFLCTLLKESKSLAYHHDHGDHTSPILVSEFSDQFSQNIMQNCIDNSKLDEANKKKLSYFLENLFNYVKKDLLVTPVLLKRNKSLSLPDAVKFFEYLECRALKSTTVRAYADILLCRTLFFIPLPAKKLFSLNPPDEKTLSINTISESLRVPESFVELWKCFEIKDRLLPRVLDEKQLHKKIARLGEYAELSIPLNPSILRSAMEDICQNELHIDPIVMKLLPSR